jgi:uncharacterized membrane protein YvbJ
MMYCPSCGAKIEKQNQRYCQQCGATLPVIDTSDAPLVRRTTATDLPVSRDDAGQQSGSLMSLMPDSFKNRLLVGAGAAVVGLVVLYVVVSAIVHALVSLVTFLLPFIIVVVAVYAGFRFLRSRV